MNGIKRLARLIAWRFRKRHVIRQAERAAAIARHPAGKQR